MFRHNSNWEANGYHMRNTSRLNQITFHNDHNATTENWWPEATVPMSAQYMPRQPWHQRALHATGRVCATIVRKVNQVLGFLLGLLTLLLIARFILTFFGLSQSLFSRWIFAASDPFMFPFANFLPITHYINYNIDGSILVAILIYWLGVFLVRRFLRLLVTHPDRYSSY